MAQESNMVSSSFEDLEILSTLPLQQIRMRRCCIKPDAILTIETITPSCPIARLESRSPISPFDLARMCSQC